MKAINYLKEHPELDLVLLDIKLPDVSGIEVLKEIKKTIPCVPTIIITAFGSESVAVKAFRCGARDYIKKLQQALQYIHNNNNMVPSFVLPKVKSYLYIFRGHTQSLPKYSPAPGETKQGGGVKNGMRSC